MASKGWGGTQATKARLQMAERLPTKCAKCGEVVGLSDPWVVGHRIPRAIAPHLTWEPTNWQVEHKKCSDASGEGVRRAAEGLKRDRARRPPGLAYFTGPRRLPNSSDWDVPWLEDLLDVPGDASWPAVMTPPHPDAVGSLGPVIEAWAFSTFKITFRWWQALAIRRQYEIDKSGELCWGEVVESGPRRIGKSVKERTEAAWRMVEWERFGEPQLIMLTGKDLPVCKEIHRKLWPWAEAQGWTVRRTNGQEEIETNTGSRFMVRSQDGVYGYDTTAARLDEGWAVSPYVVDDGLEPSMLERMQPQLVLTSTAHRKATPLMPSRIAEARQHLTTPEQGPLLLLWGADDDAPVESRDTWRQSSPHWSTHREEMMTRALTRAVSGESLDPDEGDPVESFRSQFLNVWPSRRGQAEEPVVPLGSPVAVGEPPAGCVVGIESDPGGGLWALVAGWSDGEAVRMVAVEYPSLASAVRAAGDLSPLLLVAHPAVAKRVDPAVAGAHVHAVTAMESTSATGAFRDLARSGLVAYSGAIIARQAKNARSVPAPGGEVLHEKRSTGPICSIKAASWVSWAITTMPAEPAAIY